MHIAFLTPEYPHENLNKSAGLGTSIKNSALELAQKNIKVSVFVYSQNKDEVINTEGIVIHKIAHKKYPLLGWFLYRKHIQKRINSHIKSDKIDVVEVADWTGITAFMKLNCPLLIRLHGTDAYFCNLENRKQKFKNYVFEKKALKNADKIVSVSEFAANRTKEIFNLKRDIEVVFNGINIEKFKPVNTKVRQGQILYFGSIIRKKGVLELAKAFNLLVEQKKDVSLVLLGKDVVDIFDKKSTLELFFESLSNEAKNKVAHVNEVPYHEVSKLIAESELVTLPSFAEALPMTWLEAMAMEKPLITSNIGWAKEMMIDGETGFMINPKNHQDYANKMQQLLEDQDLANNFGKQARKVVLEKFESKMIAEKNSSLYKRINTKKGNKN